MRQRQSGWFGPILGLMILLGIVVWVLSSVGHVLGLTPSFAEATDRPEGWVSQHYRHVFWGYVLTLAVLATAAALGWMLLRTSQRQESGDSAALRRVAALAGALVVAVVALPIGPRIAEDVAAQRAAHPGPGDVPKVVGMSAAEAEDALDDRNLDASFAVQPSDDYHCRVVSQNPTAFAHVAEFSDVRLRCRVVIPRVVGRRPYAAEERLQDVGLDAKLVNEPANFDDDRCRVASQGGRRTAEPDATIALRLRCPKPRLREAAVRAVTRRACNANYAGACLKSSASDYDCAGGQGDGPEYLSGTATVVGFDEYDLDRDDNGIACDT